MESIGGDGNATSRRQSFGARDEPASRPHFAAQFVSDRHR
jgi:hypothetical protein